MVHLAILKLSRRGFAVEHSRQNKGTVLVCTHFSLAEVLTSDKTGVEEWLRNQTKACGSTHSTDVHDAPVGT